MVAERGEEGIATVRDLTDELERIGTATELRVASVHKDGSLRPFVTIWVVRVGADIYIRSASSGSGSSRCRTSTASCSARKNVPLTVRSAPSA